MKHPKLKSFQLECYKFIFFQIPVLALIAITSAYYCGRRTYSASREYLSTKAINFRLFITICLAILPIIKAYIILTNTTLPLNNLEAREFKIQLNNTRQTTAIPLISSTTSLSWIKSLEDKFNGTGSLANLLFSSGKRMRRTLSQETQHENFNIKFSKLDDKATSAKPVDYLVAGTEGLAWIIHFCFTLSLRKSSMSHPRGPVFIRVLIVLLLGISGLFLKNHFDQKPQDDVLPNLSLGFSITEVVLLVLYVLTLIPDRRVINRRRNSRLGEVSVLN